MVLRTLVASICALAAAQAYAGSNAASPTTISLDNLKAKCSEIAANPQMKPVSVNVVCEENQLYWTPGAESKPKELPNSKSVSVSLGMKTFQSTPVSFSYTAQGTPYSCPSFVQVERHLGPANVTLDCQQILQIQNLGDYCAPIVEQRAQQDASLVSERQLPNQISFCPTAE